MKIKITAEGQPCRHCDTPVIKRYQDFLLNPIDWNTAYHWAWWFYCEHCHTVYFTEQAKIPHTKEALAREGKSADAFDFMIRDEEDD